MTHTAGPCCLRRERANPMESGNSGRNKIWVGAEMPYSHSSMAYHNAAASRPAGSPAASCAAAARNGVRRAIPVSDWIEPPICADLHGGTALPHAALGLHQDCSQCLPSHWRTTLCLSIAGGPLPFAALFYASRCPKQRCTLSAATLSGERRPLDTACCQWIARRWTLHGVV